MRQFKINIYCSLQSGRQGSILQRIQNLRQSFLYFILNLFQLEQDLSANFSRHGFCHVINSFVWKLLNHLNSNLLFPGHYRYITLLSWALPNFWFLLFFLQAEVKPLLSAQFTF